MKALIDADVLLYRCGFAAQKTEYYAEDRKTGELIACLPTKTEILAEVHSRGRSMPNTSIKRRVVPEPFSFAAHTVKVQIQSILENAGADEYCLYLSPEDRSIFRYDIAVTAPYKGNRKAEKPYHYKKLREYMEKYHPFKCVPGIEADDAMGIDQDKESVRTIICSIDKDMLQIPSLHYNFVSGELKNISEFGYLQLSDEKPHKLTGGGIKWFYAQMLLGDTVDNIKGIDGIGPVGTFAILDLKKTEAECQRAVMADYKREYQQNALERFNENADLLWIMRNKNEKYSSRRVLNE